MGKLLPIPINAMKKLLPGLLLNNEGQASLEAGRQRRPTVAFGNLPLTGQAGLEMTISLICVFILLFGALNVFLWVNKKMVHRQEYYEHGSGDLRINGTTYGGDYTSGRVAAADSSGDVPLVKEKLFSEKLDIFGTQ